MTQSIIRFRFLKTTLLWALLIGGLFSACSKSSTPAPPPVDKSTLTAAVTAATTLYTTTGEGTKPGEYEAGSQATYKAVIDAANAVLTSSTSTQSDVTNAVAQLAAATTAYGTHKIKEISAANLIGFWKFNGNSKDSSGNTNDGVLTMGHAFYGAGTPVLTPDRFGRADMAYHFDKGGNVEVPYTANLNPSQMSISMWIKKDTAGRTINTDTYTMFAMNRWNGYKLQLQSANKVFYTVKGVNGTDTAFYDRDDVTAVLTNETWYHVVVTYKAGEMDFYVNGDLVKSWTDTPNPPITLTTPINITIGQDLPTAKYLTVDGDFQVAWGGFFTGDMDDVMFYNVALDGTQVKSIYTNQKTL